MANTATGTLRVTMEVSADAEYGITGNKATDTVILSNTWDIESANADHLYHDDGEIAHDGTLDIDLTDLVDPFGASITFATIDSIMIRNVTAEDGSDLIVGGAASNAWSPFVSDPSDKIVIPPGHAIPLPGGTVDGTHKLLRLAHDTVDADPVEYEIIITGKVA